MAEDLYACDSVLKPNAADGLLDEWKDFLLSIEWMFTQTDGKWSFSRKHDDEFWGSTFETAPPQTYATGSILRVPLSSSDKDIKLSHILSTFGVPKTGVPPQVAIIQEVDTQSDTRKQSEKGAATASTEPKSLAETILDQIGLNTILHIDKSAARNALWLTPGNYLRVDVEFTFVFGSYADQKPKDLKTEGKDPGDGKLKGQESQDGEKEGQDEESIAEQFTGLLKNFGVDLDAAIRSMKVSVRKTSLALKTLAQGPKDTSGNPTYITQWSTSENYSLTIQMPLSNFVLWIHFSPGGLSLTVTQDPESDSSGSLLKNIGLLPASSNGKFLDCKFLNGIKVHRLSASLSLEKKLAWRVTFGLRLGEHAEKSGKDSQGLEVYLDYDSISETFSGGLILDDFYTAQEAMLKPWFEPSQAIFAPKGYQSRPYWDIRELSDTLQSLPSVLPTAVVIANISYHKSSEKLWLHGRLIAPKTPSESLIPDPFTWDDVDISLSVGTGFSCTMASDFTFIPNLENPTDTVDMYLNVAYREGDWQMLGYAEGLKGSMLAPFFDKEYRSSVVSVLGKLQIPSLQVMYTYDKQKVSGTKEVGGVATSFAICGRVQVGELELRLFYQYTSSRAGEKTAANSTTSTGETFLPPDAPKGLIKELPPAQGIDQTIWSFECDLGASAPQGKGVKIGTVVRSIIDDAADFLPTFVSNIALPSTKGQETSPIMMKVEKFGKSGKNDQTLFVFRILISPFSFTLAQVGHQDGKKTKRVLRFAVDKIPEFDKVPLVGRLGQPFDQLEYVWVSNSDAGGITKLEAIALNNLLSGNDRFFYRELVGQGASSPPRKTDETVLAPGHHFMVIQRGEAVIDHIFAVATPTVPPKMSTPSRRANNNAVVLAVDDSSTPIPASPPSKGALEIKSGPLTINAIALQYKERGSAKTISVTMDATLIMGPISFGLLGFGFSIPLDKIKLDDFKGLVGNVRPVIRGLALSFDKPPLLIAGGFEHQTIGSGKDLAEIYLGGIGIGFPPYTFVGVGEYAVMNGYKSVFLYAKLDGPLVTLEFATISGVRMGFGFNSSVRSPDINQITSFPFINDKSAEGAGNDPMKIVKRMTQADPSVPGSVAWVSPKEHAYWLAAGMSISAFDVLTVTAVAMLAFKDSGIIISIYANAIAQMPPRTDRAIAMVYLELGMVAEMNFSDGYFRVEAALAPTSFLLVPQCHLDGGFALVYWFGSNPHAGDWVFSVGGYHPKYDKPAWYPAAHRLGISFSVSGCLMVTGQAYFAVTPKCVMGGALIHANLHLGPLKAWLDATFDCLINFHPLHYRADFHVSVGVSYNLDVLFVHIHVGCTVGAFLMVQGPEFGGVAHVDFYLFGFKVDFGASQQENEALNLLGFWEMLHAPGPDVSSPNPPDPKRLTSSVVFEATAKALGKSSEPEPGTYSYENAALKFTLEDGRFPNPPRSPSTEAAADGNPPSTGNGVKWFVKSGSLKFRIATDFALSHARVTATKGHDDGTEIGTHEQEKTGIYSRPMRVSKGITSELTITVKKKVQKPGTDEETGGWTEVTFDTKAVPIATFGKYDKSEDPSKTAATDLLSSEGATVMLPMGLIISAPLPFLAVSKIPVFRASDAAKMAIKDFRPKLKDEDASGDETGNAEAHFQTDEPSENDANESAKEVIEGDDWYLPRYDSRIKEVMAPLQDVYIPAELSEEEMNASPQERWDKTGTIWKEFAEINGGLLNGEKGDGEKDDGEKDDGEKDDGEKDDGEKDDGEKDDGEKDDEGLLGLCAKLLAWDQPPTLSVETTPNVTTAGVAEEATPRREWWQLTGKFPSKLVRGLKKDGTVVKNLEATYLALPRLAVVP
ncbi:hypothetical protein BDW02DRAFT_597979 [Decorospora gaudefroyi]|uniref:DUF6603 domain-containing protein n=1 Tax=Decorospora gaudefroyi TaxID=184978 RepID=A0A6A5KBM6_9PLEO|nr:hypothetical protein BDW02DRAFT_597979 [Decorospora gaudefroyi]